MWAICTKASDTRMDGSRVDCGYFATQRRFCQGLFVGMAVGGIVGRTKEGRVMSTGTALLTAEEYMLLPDDGRLTELVRGEVVEMAQPNIRHGEICGQVYYLLRRFLDDHPVGRP